MLWLKRCVVPTLPHEIIVAAVVYPAIILAQGRSLGLLPVMIGCLQSGLRVLCQSFCNVVVEKDNKGNIVVGLDGETQGENTKSSRRIALHMLHGMVCHALPVFNVSSTVVQRFHDIYLATGALKLEWLVHANDPTNSSEQHEVQVGKVLPDFP